MSDTHDSGPSSPVGENSAPTSEGSVEHPLLSVEGLVKEFRPSGALLSRRRETLRAVDGVSFDLGYGETLGLVGESGCGKSTIARCIVRLYDPTEGRISFMGRDLAQLGRRERRSVRRDYQMVFQDPYASMNPRLTVQSIIAEPLRFHLNLDQRALRKRIEELLELVGLSTAHAGRYPHEFSGGQRQRISIARALALNPALLVLDEPVSALDVSIQAQVVNLLKELQERLGISYLFIAHDLSVVRSISSRVAVMYLGRIVEEGTVHEVFERPVHPYTQALLSAVPVAERGGRTRPRIVLEGDLPSPANPPSGCRFRTRCWKSEALCAESDPALEDRGAHGHRNACFFPDVAVPDSINQDQGV